MRMENHVDFRSSTTILIITNVLLKMHKILTIRNGVVPMMILKLL